MSSEYTIDYPPDWGDYQPDSTWKVLRVKKVDSDTIEIVVRWSKYKY